MYYLPGSHKVNGFDDTAIGEEIGDYFERFPHFRGVMPVPGEMEPGDAGFHNGLLAHGAGPQHDPELAARHDRRLHARRIGVQRHPERPLRTPRWQP